MRISSSKVTDSMVLSDSLVSSTAVLIEKPRNVARVARSPHSFNNGITYLRGDRFSVGPEIVPQKGTFLRHCSAQGRQGGTG